MADGAVLGDILARTSIETAAVRSGGVAGRLPLSVSVTHKIEDVEGIWRALATGGIESAGQSYDFIKLWVEARRIPANDQLYVVGSLEGRPVALLPLHRRKRPGVRLYSWFPGSHVGCNAPLIDAARIGALTVAERRAFWQGIVGTLKGADLVYLKAVPETASGIDNAFAELGAPLPVETLYRAAFTNWEECNATQRSKSLRKHDRQQGDKLDAMGQVAFEVVTPGEAAGPVLDTMFRQRARRFEIMGVPDPFAPADVARFYHESIQPGSPVEVKLHVMRLNGEIVAVRYNVVHGDRLFCLISSMSDEPGIQPGSPGKQCLLRVMQTVFDEGYRVFDMGAGFTDEKRHWCNVQIGLNNHYVPLTLKGRAIVKGHSTWQQARARIKSNERLLKLAKTVRAALQRPSQRSAPVLNPESAE
jgi:CelD/BcsL family acetyltransferase involved in cellulose biosynthesis